MLPEHRGAVILPERGRFRPAFRRRSDAENARPRKAGVLPQNMLAFVAALRAENHIRRHRRDFLLFEQASGVSGNKAGRVNQDFFHAAGERGIHHLPRGEEMLQHVPFRRDCADKREPPQRGVAQARQGGGDFAESDGCGRPNH